MAISFEVPIEIEQRLRNEVHDLGQAAKEATLVEFYRQRRLTHHELAQALKLSRFQTDALLKRYRVTEDLMSVDEFMDELRATGRE